MPLDYTFELDGYVFPRADVPARGPIAEYSTQVWAEHDVIGDSDAGTILTFIGTKSQRWTYTSRAVTATKDKLLAVYNARLPVLWKTPQNTTGFNVLMTRLEIEYATPISHSKWMCEFELVRRA